MTEKNQTSEDNTGPDDLARGQRENSQIKQAYIYKDAGLTERHGYIPYWLLLVAVGLVIWGIYYLVSYWHSPGPT